MWPVLEKWTYLGVDAPLGIALVGVVNQDVVSVGEVDLPWRRRASWHCPGWSGQPGCGQCWRSGRPSAAPAVTMPAHAHPRV